MLRVPLYLDFDLEAFPLVSGDQFYWTQPVASPATSASTWSSVSLSGSFTTHSMTGWVRPPLRQPVSCHYNSSRRFVTSTTGWSFTWLLSSSSPSPKKNKFSGQRRCTWFPQSRKGYCQCCSMGFQKAFMVTKVTTSTKSVDILKLTANFRDARTGR